ncbi:hypothetical protein GGX14DRAFT_406866 [Mycena pura]|uniref:Uncharacterized protein n=1 Tax=Mycena pura TaxID=153505 RepID=A0AAD6Y2S8_9AGAR|nr:hypothetical protein GGX14DRAFT_406866 [Mycena pura]
MSWIVIFLTIYYLNGCTASGFTNGQPPARVRRLSQLGNFIIGAATLCRWDVYSAADKPMAGHLRGTVQWRRRRGSRALRARAGDRTCNLCTLSCRLIPHGPSLSLQPTSSTLDCAAQDCERESALDCLYGVSCGDGLRGSPFVAASIAYILCLARSESVADNIQDSQNAVLFLAARLVLADPSSRHQRTPDGRCRPAAGKNYMRTLALNEHSSTAKWIGIQQLQKGKGNAAAEEQKELG